MNFKNIKVPGVPGGGSGELLLCSSWGLLVALVCMQPHTVSTMLMEVIEPLSSTTFLVLKTRFILKELTLYPWFEKPIIYDVRARPHIVESSTGSHDLQMIGLRVLTRPLSNQLPTIYRTLGENYNKRVLPSIIHETLKVVVAQYNASQLITQREAVSREIRKILTERAANFNIALDDVSITSLTFGREFTAAIEAKHVAAQEAERAKFVVEKAEQDKKSAIIIAQVYAQQLAALQERLCSYKIVEESQVVACGIVVYVKVFGVIWYNFFLF